MQITQVKYKGQSYDMDTQDGWPIEFCRRCGGSGYYSFNGEHSRCYDCADRNLPPYTVVANGQVTPEAARLAYVKVLARRAADKARREAKAEAIRLAKVAARDAKFAEITADLPALAVDVTYYDNFLAAGVEVKGYAFAADKLGRGWTLSPRTIEIAQDVTRRLIAAGASTSRIVEGRRQVRGQVRSIKAVESDFGYRPTTTWKMLVELEDGTKVYGTIPAAIFGDTAVGSRVEFTATIEASRNDAGFGFFARPAAAKILV